MSKSKNPIDQLIESSYDIGRIMRQCMMNDSNDGVNFLQLHALMIVTEKPGITMKELATALHVTSPSATSLVNRLAKMKWVVRQQDAKNRKLVRLKLTAKGADVLKAQHQKRNTVIRELFGLLSKTEQRALAVLNQKLVRKFHEKSHS